MKPHTSPLLQKGKYLIVILSILILLSPNAHSSPVEITLSEQSKDTILKYTRLLFTNSGERSVGLDGETKRIKNPVIVSLFSPDGQLLISERVDKEDLSLPEKLKKAVKNIKLKLKLSQEKYKEAYIHIMVVSYTAKFANFGIKGLFHWKVYEPRVTGLIYKLGSRKVELNPLECLSRDFDSKDSRTYLANKLWIKPKDIIRYNELEIEIYRVIHFGERYPDRKLTTYHRGHKLFKVEQVNSETISHSLQWIGNWYKNNVLAGEVTYKYDPTTGQYHNAERTMVRSTMAVWVLNRLAYFLDDEELKKRGKECIDYYLQRYFDREKSLESNRLIPSGIPTEKGELAVNRYTTASFLALAILEREDCASYRRETKLLLDWVMAYQKDNGIFRTQFAQSQYFMPGQLLLAIATHYEKTKDESYKEYFDKSFAVYSPQLESMMYLGEKWYTPIAPAWFTQPFAKMYEITKDNKYRDMVYKINDRVEKWYQVNTRDSSYFDYDGILCPKPGFYGNVSITAASLESLVDACHTAKIDGDKEREAKYKNAIRHTAAYLIRLQYLPENTYYIKNRSRVLGGFKYDLVNNTIWMDNVWHLTSAFMKIIEYKILGDIPQK